MVIPDIKRVAALYRVSTKGQLDGNDIPMQERACRGFIERNHGWKLVKEYTEKGVSGFKVSAAKRDMIQQAKDDAEKGLFDILLVFMFDRLGRKDDETPFVLEWFVKQGIEMWSVVEGQQKIEAHTDRLVNYLRFWQSSGESRKTSERVNEKHTQMVEDGVFRGGGIPYGYKTIETVRKNKKGKTLLDMVINEDEASVVIKIFQLVYEEGYGQLRIAKYLNENNIPAKKAKKWGAATVNVILKNSIYKGVMRYRGKTGDVCSERIEELALVSEDIWNAVQEIRGKRNPKNENKKDNIMMSTNGSLLFIGLARCGVCDSKLTSTTFVNKYRGANGEIKRYNQNKSYRCSGKLQGKTICNGQGTFSSKKVEKAILHQIDVYLDMLKQVDLTKEINSMNEKKNRTDEKALKSLLKKIEECNEEIVILNAEVPKAIMGKSSFKPDLLSALIDGKTNEILVLKQEAEKLERQINSKNIEVKELELLKQYIPTWKEMFKEASTEKKRVMLGLIIDYVKISKEEVHVELKVRIKGIIRILLSETNYSGRAPSLVTQDEKVLTETIIIEYPKTITYLNKKRPAN